MVNCCRRRKNIAKFVKFLYKDLKDVKNETLIQYFEWYLPEDSGHWKRCMKLFDVPLHFNFQRASCGNGNFDMGSIFNGTLVKEESEFAVTFVDNHDTQPGQALQSWVMDWFKPLAYGLILLQEKGLPCVFYGDYYGIPHDHIQPVKGFDRLLKLRKSYAYGREHRYFDHYNIVGLTREGTPEKVVIGEDGKGEFFVEGGSVSVWVEE